MENIYLAIIRENLTGKVLNITAHSSKESAEYGLSIMKREYGSINGEVVCKRIYNFNA